jgi:endoglucanase
MNRLLTSENLNKLKCFIAGTIMCLALPSAGSAAVMALPGINLGNTLEATWGYTAPTKALIDSIANAGFKTLRVPCAWNYNSSPRGVINSTYMTQVTNVVNWAIADGMYVIINDHWDGGWFEENSFSRYDSKLNTKLINLWTQVANNFKNTDSTKLSFACANEPHAGSQAQVNVLYQYYQNWVNAMRANGGNNASRWLIVQGPSPWDWSILLNYGLNMPVDPARKLMIEEHTYDPGEFAAQGSDETWRAMTYFWGNGYHVVNGPTNRNQVGMEESFLQSQLGKLKTNFADRGYPVLLGEYRAREKSAWGATYPDLTGQYITQNYNSCTYWNKYMENALASYGFDGTSWVIQNDLFDSSTGAILDQTMVNAVKGISAVAPIPGL